MRQARRDGVMIALSIAPDRFVEKQIMAGTKERLITNQHRFCEVVSGIQARKNQLFERFKLGVVDGLPSGSICKSPQETSGFGLWRFRHNRNGKLRARCRGRDRQFIEQNSMRRRWPFYGRHGAFDLEPLECHAWLTSFWKRGIAILGRSVVHIPCQWNGQTEQTVLKGLRRLQQNRRFIDGCFRSDIHHSTRCTNVTGHVSAGRLAGSKRQRH